jgi:hypothetical protein
LHLSTLTITGTSVLTFAQRVSWIRFSRPLRSRSLAPPLAKKSDPRSRTCSVHILRSRNLSIAAPVIRKDLSIFPASMLRPAGNSTSSCLAPFGTDLSRCRAPSRIPTPCGVSLLAVQPEHTHCARSYSAYCHRESLACSFPFRPPCSSFRDFRPNLRRHEVGSFRHLPRHVAKSRR